MKSIVFFVTFIFVSNMLDGQKIMDVKSIVSQIDSGNHYLYIDASKADSFYTMAQKRAQDIQNDTLAAKTFVGFAVLSRLEGDYSEALISHQKALDIHVRLGDKRFIAGDYHNIGSLFRYTADFEEAKRYLLKAMYIREQMKASSEKDSVQLIISYTEVGVIYRMLNQLDSAAYFYDKAYEFSKQLNHQKMLISVNGNRASLEHYRENYQKAIELNLADISYLKTHQENSSLTTRYNNIARAYNKLKNYPLAIEYISKAIDLCEKERYYKKLYTYYLFRSQLKRKKEEYKGAFSDYRRYKRYRDTVLNLEQVEKFTEQKVAFEFKQQQLADSLKFVAAQEKLELITQSERTQKKLYLTTSILLFIIGCISWILLKNKRKLTVIALKKQQAEASLLREHLRSTEKEAARIVAENEYKIEQKKNLLHYVNQIQQWTKDHRVNKALNSLALSMNMQLTKEEQRLFLEQNRDQFHTFFEENLIEQFPSLTKGERELCKLIRMNKSIKEIMELKSVSSDSVRSRRYRIRKKLGLSRDQELEQFLKQV